MPGQIDRAAVQAESDVYMRLGRVLLEMIHPEHAETWKEVLLNVEHVVIPGAPEAYTMETTAVLQTGERLPLVARPEIMAAAQELDRLCREQSGKAWKSFNFRLYRDDGGAAFQCRYTYPDVAH
jgi:hypothetical protein